MRRDETFDGRTSNMFVLTGEVGVGIHPYLIFWDWDKLGHTV